MGWDGMGRSGQQGMQMAVGRRKVGALEGHGCRTVDNWYSTVYRTVVYCAAAAAAVLYCTDNQALC